MAGEEPSVGIDVSKLSLDVSLYPWAQPVSRLRWSIPIGCEILPVPLVGWPRPINWMHRCWPNLARWCGLKSGLCPMPPARPADRT